MQQRVPLAGGRLLGPPLEQRMTCGSYFFSLGLIGGEEHEGTFVDYNCHWLDARNRRIRPITERAAENQLTRSGAKSDQSEFVGAVSRFGTVSVLVNFYAEFDPVCPERPIDAFRDIEITDHDQSVST
jgi:hypothetical protein